VVRDELLLEAAEVEVATVAEELGAVRLVADVQRIAAQQMEELGEDVAGAIGDAGRDDSRRSEETVAVQSGEDFAWGGEEGAEAECEEIGRVAWTGEDVAGDLKGAVADLDDDFGFEELRDESGYCCSSDGASRREAQGVQL
jgi:hypothetical protein